MNPPARTIRSEFHEAVVRGIRQRGADAVGLVIMGVAYLMIAVLALLVLLFASSVLGIKQSALPVTVMTILSAGASWLIGKSIKWPFRSLEGRPGREVEGG